MSAAGEERGSIERDFFILVLEDESARLVWGEEGGDKGAEHRQAVERVFMGPEEYTLAYQLYSCVSTSRIRAQNNWRRTHHTRSIRIAQREQSAPR